jgi:hypothetical protein
MGNGGYWNPASGKKQGTPVRQVLGNEERQAIAWLAKTRTIEKLLDDLGCLLLGFEKMLDEKRR